jgi:PAS domain S-box-containing protein
LVTTLSGKIKKLNPSAQVLLEYDEVELIGQPITKVIKEVDIYKLEIGETESIDVSQTFKEVETVCHSKSGKIIPVAFSYSLIQTEIEHFQGYVYILRDMTERKQMELAKQEFLAMISHEVRTPIAAVTGMASLLQDTKLTAEQRDFVDTIYNSGNYLLKIINDFLDFSKIESGNLELEEQPFALRNCINEALDLLAPKAREKGLKLTFLDSPELPTTIVGDITRLRQVLINLLSNAIKFTQTGSIEISVITRTNSDINDSSAANTYEIQFTVKDTGIGIPRDRLERLFKAFSQVNSSITRQYGGTGLGLAICKQLCELMGGRIWVESELSKGSTFYFTITASVISEKSAVETRHQSLQGGLGGFADLKQVAWEPSYPSGTLSANGFGGDARSLLASPLGRRLANAALTQSTQSGGTPLDGFPGLKEVPSKTATPSLQRAGSLIASVQELAVTNHENNGNYPVPNCHELRILLTEDNLVNQKVALKQLKSLGYSADVANNGKEALELLEKIPYDLILMDYQMPILDGLETTKEIHRWQESCFASGRRPIVIAMTANAMKEDKQMCLDAGMDDYLSKPVMKENLAAALEYWASVIFREKEAFACEQTVSTTDIGSIDLAIDWERLHQLSENNLEFELELLQIFVEDTQLRLEVIKIAIAASDFEQLAREAHQIKGASANIGAITMCLAGEKLEQLAHNQERRGTANFISELEEFVKRIQEFIKNRN